MELDITLFSLTDTMPCGLRLTSCTPHSLFEFDEPDKEVLSCSQHLGVPIVALQHLDLSRVGQQLLQCLQLVNAHP